MLPAISLAMALISPASAASAALERDCHLKQYASLELTETVDGNLLVPVTIAERPVYMVLNSGAALSGITDEAAGLLGLATKSLPRPLGVNVGRALVHRTITTKGFSIGEVHYTVAQFLVLPTDVVGHPVGEIPVVGALGMDMFSKVDVELDAAHHKLNLFSPDHCSGHAVYWSRGYDAVPISVGELGEIYFPMVLNGQRIETTLATGSAFTTLTGDVANAVYHFDPSSPDVEKQTSADGVTIGYFRAMNLTGDSLKITNAHVRLIEPPNKVCHVGRHSDAVAYEGCSGRHPLELGRSVLSKLRIFIATKEKTLYFTAADAHE